MCFLCGFKTSFAMETKPHTNRSASFVCNRKALLSVLSSIKMRKDAKLTITTAHAEQKIILKTNVFEVPISCTGCKGSDTSFGLLLIDLKNYCKLIPDETIRFTLEGDTLQINTTVLNIK